MKILVTGATGFISGALVRQFKTQDNLEVIAAVRKKPAHTPDDIRYFEVADLSEYIDWSSVLTGVDVVIHTAARVHVMKDRAADPLKEFRQINVKATQSLAQQAARAGVKRFVFISSIKVNGEETLDKPFFADDQPAPQDAYGISKWEAEMSLKKVAAETGMEIVIIRPPLVYGPGVKANFRTLIRLAKLGLPLPLGAIHNRRSMVFLGNLVDFIVVCSAHPQAANQIFLISDGEDVSTTQLLRLLSAAMEKKSYLLPIPSSVLRMFIQGVGQANIAQKLCGSLQVDIQKNKDLLGWKPPVNIDEGLKKTV